MAIILRKKHQKTSKLHKCLVASRTKRTNDSIQWLDDTIKMARGHKMTQFMIRWHKLTLLNSIANP
jgi:hypothetical protein